MFIETVSTTFYNNFTTIQGKTLSKCGII